MDTDPLINDPAPFYKRLEECPPGEHELDNEGLCFNCPYWYEPAERTEDND